MIKRELPPLVPGDRHVSKQLGEAVNLRWPCPTVHCASTQELLTRAGADLNPITSKASPRPADRPQIPGTAQAVKTLSYRVFPQII